MPLDLAGNNWTKIFRGEIIKWPELLDKNVWDKKKGKILTATKSTGIGEALKKCEDAFKAAKIGEYVCGGRNPDEADAYLKNTLVPFINGSAIKKLKDLAVSTAKDLKKMPLIPSSTKKLVDEIAAGAEELMVFCNTNTLSGLLASAQKDAVEVLNAKQRKMAPFSTAQARGVGQKARTAIAKIRQDLGNGPLDPEKVKTASAALFDACRDVTQPLQNFLKSVKAGVTFENFNQKGIETLAKLLVPYGDGQEANLGGLDRQAIDAKLLNVEKMSTAYDKLVDPIKHVG
jgi:hypothetical protein